MEAEPDYIREEIDHQASMLKGSLDRISDLENTFNQIFKKEFDEIWFTGSGDSHCASIFGSFFCDSLGIKGRYFTPMELSNFVSMDTVKNPILVAISVSGKTPRVLEVVKRFKTKFPNAVSIGLTDNPESPIFKESSNPVLIKASPKEALTHSDYVGEGAKDYNGYHHDVAQTKTFFGNILILIIMILLTSKNHNVKEILEQINSKFTDNTKINELKVFDSVIKNPQTTIFSSSGIFRSLAQFAKYKWFEFALSGSSQEIEEYAHTNYFVTDEKTTILFIAPKGPILDRAKELIEGALGDLIQPQILLVTDVFLPDYSKYTSLKILNLMESGYNVKHEYKNIEFYLYALLCIELYAYQTAKMLGRNTNTFRGGIEGEKYVSGSLKTIRKSKIN